MDDDPFGSDAVVATNEFVAVKSNEKATAAIPSPYTSWPTSLVLLFFLVAVGLLVCDTLLYLRPVQQVAKVVVPESFTIDGALIVQGPMTVQGDVSVAGKTTAAVLTAAALTTENLSFQVDTTRLCTLTKDVFGYYTAVAATTPVDLSIFSHTVGVQWTTIPFGSAGLVAKQDVLLWFELPSGVAYYWVNVRMQPTVQTHTVDFRLALDVCNADDISKAVPVDAIDTTVAGFDAQGSYHLQGIVGAPSFSADNTSCTKVSLRGSAITSGSTNAPITMTYRVFHCDVWRLA